jgi:hypothetical protein
MKRVASQPRVGKRPVIAAGAVLCAMLVLAPAAYASTKAKSVTVSGNGVVGDVTAKCKSGQRATGGGFLTSPTASGRAVVVIKSVKSGQKAWEVAAQLVDVGPVEPATVTAYVYCNDKSRAPKTGTASHSVTTSSTNFINDVRCRGAKAQAGGFSISPPVFTGNQVTGRISDSFRFSKSTWRNVFTVTGAQSFSLTTFTYCAKVGVGSKVGSATGITPLSALSASCSKGIAAGGFSQSPYGRQIVYQSMKSGKAWRTSGVQLSPPPPQVTSALTSRAYCL